MAWEAAPTNLDPRYGTDAKSSQIAQLVFQSLAELDASFLYRPGLAEWWQSPDALTYVFKLKSGSRFHDETLVTPADVKSTFDWILDPRHASPKRAPLERIRDVRAEDPDRVVFRLKEPFAPFLGAALIRIVSRRSSRYQDAAGLVGSGPYRLKSVRGDEEILLERSDSSSELPKVTRILFRIIPDAVVRTLELKKGAVDLVQNEVDYDTVPWLERRGRIQKMTIPGTIVQYLGLNDQDPHLKKKEVRQALALALDRRGIIEHLLRGYATEATGLLSPRHWAYEGEVSRYPYDPERAKRLLDSAGFRDPDDDGPQSRFTLVYKTSTLDLRRRIAEAIQEQMRAVGVRIEIQSYEFATLYADVKKGNFQLFSMDWVGINDPDVYYELFHSRSVPPYGNNRGRFHHPQMDRLTERGRKTLNLEARRTIYREVQRLAAEELPLIPLWWFTNVALMGPRLHGFAPHPSGDLFALTKSWKE